MLLCKLHVNDIQINYCMKHVKPIIYSGFTKHFIKKKIAGGNVKMHVIEKVTLKL